ncbi:MAG TPA: UMP kinase [Candidatus Paceibacterota bacterium]|nr:UMP kinase [Candidatus Paceibacterota bacterium]
MKAKAKSQSKAPIVISVGGSLLVPDEIDTTFLASFKSFVDGEIKKGNRFIIVCGGGRVCRKYQNAAKLVGNKRASDIDWLGIHATRLNAQLVKTIFLPKAEEIVVHDPFDKTVKFNKPVLVAAGWKPGWSTDFDAVCLAKRYKAKKLINLSNIDYVYTADPRTNPDARKIEKITWKEFRSLIPKKWDPGLSAPFDPIASKEAHESGIEVAVINGDKLEGIQKFIKGEEFVGTLIH